MKQTINHYFDVLKVRNVTVLTIVIFFYSLTFYTTTFTLFLKERGLDYWEIFLLESVLSAAIFLFEVPSGYIADRIGRKKVILFSVFCYALSTWITAIAYDLWAFILESAIYGIGIACLSGADSALLYESLEKKGKKSLSDYAFSLTGGAVTLAMVISLPIGGWLSERSLNIPIYVTSASLLVAIIVAFMLCEEQKQKEEKREAEKIFQHFALLIKQNKLLVILQMLNSVAFTFIFSLMYLNQPLFIEYEIDLTYFGIIMLVVNAVNSVIIFVSPVLKKKLGPINLMFLSTLLPGILFLLLMKNDSAWLGIILLIGIFGFDTIKSPIYRAFLNDRINNKDRATILSVISFSGSLIGMGAKPLVGWLADMGLSMLFLIAGISLILASFGIWYLTRKIERNKKRL